MVQFVDLFGSPESLQCFFNLDTDFFTCSVKLGSTIVVAVSVLLVRRLKRGLANIAVHIYSSVGVGFGWLTLICNPGLFLLLQSSLYSVIDSFSACRSICHRL